MPTREYVCGLDAAVSVIGGKWRVLIVWALQDRSLRFGELKRAISGVSEKVLVEQLRELEASGVVSREAYDEARPRVEYSLTPLGHDLNRALVPLGDWGNARLKH